MMRHLAVQALRAQKERATVRTKIPTHESVVMALYGRKAQVLPSSCPNKNVTKQENPIIQL